MKFRVAAAALTLLGLCCVATPPSRAAVRDQPPLKLEFLAPLASPAIRAQVRQRPGAMPVRGRHLHAARDELPLRQRALQSVLAESELAVDETDPGDPAQNRFRFEKRGTAARDISRGYRDMCARVSNRIWDEPNGRRVKFDIAGKPGVAVEIPLR